MTTVATTIDPVVAETPSSSCHSCHRPIGHGETEFIGTDPYCSECVEQCEDCDEFVLSATISNGCCPSCDEQYWTCDSCSDRTHVEQINRTSSGAQVCDDCLGEYYTFCDACDEYEPNGDRCCSSDDLLCDYSYKPCPIFRQAKDETYTATRPYFGVELETEAVRGDLRDGVELVESVLGELIYLKSDGSLDDGFEIVTHPMSLAFAQSQDWSVLRSLADIGFRSWQTETCGIHVHVSRAAFSNRSHLWRFAYLFYRNPAHWQRFAGRCSDDMASFSGRGEVTKVLKQETSPERYVAVNLCNEETVEVRMFRGSLMPDRLLADVECVASALEYTRHLSVPAVFAGALDWWDFRSYLNEEQATYPHLVAALAKGGH